MAKRRLGYLFASLVMALLLGGCLQPQGAVRVNVEFEGEEVPVTCTATRFDDSGSTVVRRLSYVEWSDSEKAAVASLPIGNWRIACPKMYSPFSTRFLGETAQDVEVTLESEAVISTTLALPGHVSGKVVDSSGQGIPGVYVSADIFADAPESRSKTVGQTQVTETQTDDQGRFDIDLPPNSNFTAEIPNGEGERTFVGVLYDITADPQLRGDLDAQSELYDTQAITGLTIVAGTVLSDTNITLNTLQSGIRGKVHSFYSVLVQVFSAGEDEAANLVAEARLGKPGIRDVRDYFYEIPLPPGEYIVKFSTFREPGDIEPTEHRFYPDKLLQANATDVAVSEGQVINGIDATVDSLASIQGTVTDSSGQPITEAKVTAYAVEDGWVGELKSATTGFAGEYRLSNIPIGCYLIKFEEVKWQPSRYITEYWDDQQTLDQAGEVCITGGDDEIKANAVLMNSGAQ